MTRYAAEILKIIEASQEHPTAEQIFLEMKALEPKIVLATVYNNLNALSCDGKIRRIAVEGVADRYDKIKKHDHLVCRICGRLCDFEFEDITSKLQSQLNSEILNYDLKVFYVCPECGGGKAK